MSGYMIEARMTKTARDTIRAHGMTVAAFKRAYFPEDGKWHGDECGCVDDRCITFHHEREEECQCLPQWIRDAQLAAVPKYLRLHTPLEIQSGLARLMMLQQLSDDAWQAFHLAEAHYRDHGYTAGPLLQAKDDAWAAVLEVARETGQTHWQVCHDLDVEGHDLDAHVARLLAQRVKPTLTPQEPLPLCTTTERTQRCVDFLGLGCPIHQGQPQERPDA